MHVCMSASSSPRGTCRAGCVFARLGRTQPIGEAWGCVGQSTQDTPLRHDPDPRLLSRGSGLEAMGGGFWSVLGKEEKEEGVCLHSSSVFLSLERSAPKQSSHQWRGRNPGPLLNLKTKNQKTNRHAFQPFVQLCLL